MSVDRLAHLVNGGGVVIARRDGCDALVAKLGGGTDADGITATLAMVDGSVNTAKQYVIFQRGPKSARRNTLRSGDLQAGARR